MSHICLVPLGETWQCGCSFRNAQSFPPPLPPPPPSMQDIQSPRDSVGNMALSMLGSSAPIPPAPSILRSARKRMALRFWFSPSSLPHPGPIAHLSLKRKTMLGIAENGNSLRRSCEFGSDLLWPPPLESEGQYMPPNAHTHFPQSSDHLERLCVLRVVLSGVWGTMGPSVCLCLESCAVNFMTLCV